MLPLLRNCLSIELSPHQLVVTDVRRGWRSREVITQTLTVPPVTGVVWQDCVAALRAWLEQASPAGAELRVVLADSLVRYVVLPWSPQVFSSGERTALARIRFETLYGPSAAGWDIRATSAQFGQSSIACALERTLREALQEAAAAHGLRLSSLQPRFIRRFNHWRQRLGPDALLAVVEAGHCLLVSWNQGAWHSIRSASMTPALTDELARLIGREIVLQGLDARVPLFLYAGIALDTERLCALRPLTLLTDADGVR